MVEDAQVDRYRWLQRLLEMVPGLISWAIILGPIWLSFSNPWLVAYFVLTFDFYMLCRSLWLGVTVVIGFRRVRRQVAQESVRELLHLVTFDGRISRANRTRLNAIALQQLRDLWAGDRSPTVMLSPPSRFIGC